MKPSGREKGNILENRAEAQPTPGRWVNGNVTVSPPRVKKGRPYLKGRVLSVLLVCHHGRGRTKGRIDRKNNPSLEKKTLGKGEKKGLGGTRECSVQGTRFSRESKTDSDEGGKKNV